MKFRSTSRPDLRITPPDSLLVLPRTFSAAPLSRDARLCPPAIQRGEMSSRQWCVWPRSLPAPTRAPGGPNNSLCT
eukprot:scaffold36833_cov100-Phaeocystis_antarctica.AAC.5